MGKTWAEVEGSNAYKELSDEDKSGAKKQYFDEIVSKKKAFNDLSVSDRELARSEFFGSESPRAKKSRTKKTMQERIKEMPGFESAKIAGEVARGIIFGDQIGVSNAMVRLPGEIEKQRVNIQDVIKQVASPLSNPILDRLPKKPFGAKKDDIDDKGFGGLGISPRSIGRLVEDIATDPFVFGGAVAGGLKATTKGVSTIGKTILKEFVGKKALLKKVSQLDDKASEIITQILNPTKAQLAESVKRGTKFPAVKEVQKIMKESKTFGELQTNVQATIKSIFKKRNDILVKKNKNITRDYTDDLSELIKTTKKLGQATPAEIKQMEAVLAREKEFFSTNKLNRVSGQARKEELQRRTKNILDKRAAGNLSSKENSRLIAEDAIRFGLKKAVEAGDQEVAKLNSTYKGLLDAEDLLAKQGAAATLEPSSNFLSILAKRFASSVGFNPQHTAARFIGKTITGKIPLQSKTAEVVKLSNKAKKLIELANQAS